MLGSWLDGGSTAKWLTRRQQPLYAGNEAVRALRNWKAVLVELERSRAIRRLSPAAHRRLSAPKPLGARLLVERGGHSVAELAQRRLAVRLATSHR
jgi:hypothetical protein